MKNVEIYQLYQAPLADKVGTLVGFLAPKGAPKRSSFGVKSFPLT